MDEDKEDGPMMSRDEMKATLESATTAYNVDQFEFDLLDRLGSMFMLHEDGKLRPAFRTMDPETPWMFVRPKPGLDCHIWHQTMFEKLGIFPPGCENCWKVVVRPRNFKELIMLLELQENYTTRYCKCGFEERPYVFGNWGGYFYCTGKEEGLDVYAEVRAMVDEFISPDVPVILKRYCTEYEHKWGPSDTFCQGRDDAESREKAAIWAQIIEKHVDFPKFTGMPGILKAHVISKWIKKAYERGDKTVLEFNMGDEASRANGGHLVRQLVTYHKEGEKNG